MPEFVRHDVTKNDKEVVKLAGRAYVADKHPRLRPGGEPEFVRRSMKVPCHLCGNKFQYDS